MKNQFLILLGLLICFLISCNSKERNNKNSAGNRFIFPENYIKILDSSLVENSGLIMWNNYFWTFNDSGGKNELYGLDFKTGKIQCTIQINNATNVDWEDIAQDKYYIYIADTGNNFGDRHDQKIYRIKKKKINSKPFQSFNADIISFKFADQFDFTNAFHQTRYDCEALLSTKDSLFVFTKDWIKNSTKVYGFPAEIGDYNVSPIDSFNTNGLVTGADILPNGKFALIGYRNFRSFMWTFQKTNSNFFANPRFFRLEKLENAQTEGICYTTKGDLFISCEQTANYLPQIWKIGKKQLY
jgi:hypothetical protein